ncbi:phospholipid-transporting ATPase 2 [Iris pallida]|uniref:Phospholipid-transporting ATPase 2 n=1 Tax=Iris pallida TaxID=29817 RepID=A0AAX6FYJ4_IRIPA|nr:phospholipid-transporting ATPase 2 [Iris pallida]
MSSLSSNCMWGPCQCVFWLKTKDFGAMPRQRGRGAVLKSGPLLYTLVLRKKPRSCTSRTQKKCLYRQLLQLTSFKYALFMYFIAGRY